MNRYEPQSLLTEARPPRGGVVWGVSAIVGVVTLGVIGLIFYAPIAAFEAKWFPAQPPAAVSTAAAAYTDWLPLIEVVGSLKPVRGADLSVEVPGIVAEVDFESGGDVESGAQLIKLRDNDDVAKLHTLEAARDLAQSNFARDEAQLAR